MDRRRESSPLLFVAALAIVATLAAVASALAEPVSSPAVRDAIARAVAERVGADAVVSVTALQTTVADARTLTASVDPAARTGMPSRFALFAAGSRVGTAVATVQVVARHVRTLRPIGRDAIVSSADVEAIAAALVDQPIRRVPSLAEAIGARVRRDVVAGEALTSVTLDVPTVVKSGDVVAVVLRIGAVEAEARGVASGSGRIGDVIRVTNHGMRRPLRARITGPGAVEVIQ